MREYFQKHPRYTRAVQLETLCMILRYAYYVTGTKLVDDLTYDYLEAEAIPLVGEWSPLHLPGSSLVSDYHEFTIAAADNREYIDHLLEEVTELC
jgi:hypothetical protein